MAQVQDIPLLPGSTLGPYRLEEWLGRTETGDLYRAEDPASGAPRLIKLVHPKLTALPGFRAALHQQSLFLSALVHPNIVQVLRIEESAERCFVVMEWLPGGTLRGLLGRRGNLAEDLPLALDLAAQVAEALAFAHAQGFVHGGLSPEDLLLARRGDGGYNLQVSDFGLAWLLLDYPAQPEPWADSLVYALTPEHSRGQESDDRGDQYALGAILYELVTGCAPFAARTLEEALDSHGRQEPVPPSALVAGLPPGVEAIILRCLARDGSERFATTGDLATALRDLLASGVALPAELDEPDAAAPSPVAPAEAPEAEAAAGHGALPEAAEALDTADPGVPLPLEAAASALAPPAAETLDAADPGAPPPLGAAASSLAPPAAKPPAAISGDEPTAIFAAPRRFWAPSLEATVAPPAPAPPVETTPAPAAPEPAPEPEPVLDELEALLRTPVRQFEPPDLIGEEIAGYRVESFLGPTETGPVYQARRTGSDSPQALKIISPALTQNRGFRERFHRRKEAIRSLRHPHIVAIEAIGEEGGLCYVAVEWLPDGTLRNFMQRRGSGGWSLPLALDLTRQAAEALAFAHAQGFTHTSIKPNNLILAYRSGQGGYTLKVSDFGLVALLMEQDGVLEEIWGDSLIYALSPERCRGLEVDGRSDQYALGVILYEISTGSVPFEAKTLDAAVFRHVYTAPVPPRDLAPDLPPMLEAIILRCLEKAPADRFADARDLATALQDLLRSPAMAPKPAALPGPARSNAPAPAASGPITPRVQALDQYGRVLATHALTGDGLTVGRNRGNAIVLDSDAVEPFHLEVDWDGSAILAANVASGGAVMLGDAPLRPGETRVWHWEEPMRLGTFWLRAEPVARTDPAAPTAAPAQTSAFDTVPVAFTPPPSAAAPVVITLPTPGAPTGFGRPITVPPDPAALLAEPPSEVSGESLTDRIGLIPDQESLTLTPGRPAIFRLTLINLGAIVDHFKVTVEGVPESWIVGQRPQVQLNPGAKELVTLNILVPQLPESRAGEYPVTLRARSRESQHESNTAPALWTVLPFASSSFDLRPKRQQRLRKGAYRVQVQNQGNAPVAYTLSAGDEEEVLGFLFGNDRLILEPGAVARTDLQVRPNQTRWFGQPAQHRFVVQAKPSGAGDTHNNSAQLVQLVVFPRWLLLLLLLGLLFGLAGAWLWYRPDVVALDTVPDVPVAGVPFAVKWAVTNGPTVQLLVNQTVVPIPPGSNNVILPGYQSPPEIQLQARNEVLGRDSNTINVSLIAPSPTFTSTPTPRPSATPIPPPPPTVAPPPTLAPTEPPTPTVPSPTPTITPTPTSQSLCLVNNTLTLTGEGPPQTALIAYFAGRPVGGGQTDATGRFTIVLGRFQEEPGLHPLTVEVRDTREVLLAITCIVPTPIPLETSTPRPTSATPGP